ncbi:MAG TPA: OsmC family protein [Vicinamibacterales bacterium]|nr:OsmC family protein [Vicinamibacterales bacterium]
MPKPPITATLTWQGDLRFQAATPRTSIVLDSSGAAGPSPPEAIAMALAGCMAVDVADIVIKGRHTLKQMETRVVGHRRDDPPSHFVSFTLHFVLTGDIPSHAVERAIQLSRDKYCSVWHSLRQDIDLQTTFEVAPGPFDSAKG